MTKAVRINYMNILFMLLSVAAAIYLPFELFLFSYAFLGPAHYLTEISWLHDRKYFIPRKADLLLLGAITLLYIILITCLPHQSALWMYTKKYSSSIIFFLFGLALTFTLVHKLSARLWLTGLLLCGVLLISSYNFLSLLFGLFLPTLIHVYLFTGAFLLYGALKTDSFSGYLSFMVFLLCPFLCLLILPHYSNGASQWAMSGYHSFSRLNRSLLNSLHLTSDTVFSNGSSILLTRIIAFAYTYHYLNWFSKTSVIQWHRISRVRFILVIILFLIFISVYIWNYKTGLQTLFFLSFLHVVLEFPLNHRSFIGITKELHRKSQRLTRSGNTTTA